MREKEIEMDPVIDTGSLAKNGVLPVVIDLPTAAAMLGIGRTLAYELVRTGRWPTPIVRLGRLIKVPKQPLLDLILIHPEYREP